MAEAYGGDGGCSNKHISDKSSEAYSRRGNMISHKEPMMTWELSKKEHRYSRKRLEEQASWEIPGRERRRVLLAWRTDCSKAQQQVESGIWGRRGPWCGWIQDSEKVRVEGPLPRPSRGVMLRGLHIYTDGNGNEWKKSNLSHVNCISFILMNRPLLFFWGQDQAPWPGEWRWGTSYYQDRGGYKIEVGLHKEKPPIRHSFAWWFSVL